MKQLLLMIAVVALVGCGSPKGINQTSKVKIGTPIWEFQTGTSRFGSGVGSSPAIKTDSKGLAKSPWPMRGQNALHTGRVMKK
jgi:hypothetical protein